MNAPPEAAERLVRAAEASDKIGAWEATGRLISWLSDLRNRVDAQEIRGLVWKGAISHRWFDIAEVLAGAAAGRADAAPETRRLHAQMLMERGFYDEALARLRVLLEQAQLAEYERGQAWGHVGRIYKERFVAALAARDETAARKFLEHAIHAYLNFYDEHPTSVWHGINVVALLAHPEAVVLRRDAAVAAQQIAHQVLVETARQTPDEYTDATIAVANIALGKYREALDSIRDYVTNPKVNAFQFGNLRRELTQIWGLDRRPSPGPELVALVNAALLERENGELRLSGEDIHRARQVSRTDYEAVFGADRFDSFENYLRGLERCACVARIGRTAEVGVGTGFIIPGNALRANLNGSFVLVTNAHVISKAESERKDGALHPSEAVVTFAALEGVSPNKEFGLGQVVLSSPPEELDVTIVELNQPVVSKSVYPIATVLPIRNSNSQVRVVGHPSGRGLSLSVNQLLDHEVPKLHYRTATEGGSSGSPVFNQEWKLIGLHHAGGGAMQKLNGLTGTYEANEGIWIRAICEAAQIL